MLFTKRKRNKFWPAGHKRETAYYWVVFHEDLNRNEKYERVGHYNSGTERWHFPGDGRAYEDADIISVDERPILRHMPVNVVERVLVWGAILVILWHFTGYIKQLIDYLFKP